MADDIDLLPCDDVACAAGGHRACRGEPPAAVGFRGAGVEASPRVGSESWWVDTVARMQRRTREDA